MKKMKEGIKNRLRGFQMVAQDSLLLQYTDRILSGLGRAFNDCMLARVSRKLSLWVDASKLMQVFLFVLKALRSMATKLEILIHRWKSGSYLVTHGQKFWRKYGQNQGIWLQTITIFGALMLLFIISTRQFVILEIVLLFLMVVVGAVILGRDFEPNQLLKESFLYRFFCLIFYFTPKEEGNPHD